MLTATAPCYSGAPPESDSGADLARLLDACAAGDDTSLPCRTHDPDLWFAEAPAELERAKELCVTCPVRRACLASALSRQEAVGRLGRRDLRARCCRPPQAPTWPAEQGRSGARAPRAGGRRMSHLSHHQRVFHDGFTNQETVMLLYEVLARARMREDQQYAREARLARRLASARRWRRLACYAGRRASRAAAGL